jgi:hypothetical protein
VTIIAATPRKPDSIDPKFRLDLVASPPESETHLAFVNDGSLITRSGVASFREFAQFRDEAIFSSPPHAAPSISGIGGRHIFQPRRPLSESH